MGHSPLGPRTLALLNIPGYIAVSNFVKRAPHPLANLLLIEEQFAPPFPSFTVHSGNSVLRKTNRRLNLSCNLNNRSIEPCSGRVRASPATLELFDWWTWPGSNRRPPACKA
jgi:hypothetical protein